MKKKKCKYCKEEFHPVRPLQNTCSVVCAIKLINEQKKKKEQKKWGERKKELSEKLYPEKDRSVLQKEINKLARLIDGLFYNTCIDCDKPYGKQIDGAHFHSVGSSSSIRYNLHNIHSAKSSCNQYSDTHKEGYRIGLEKRYSSGYLQKVENLKTQYTFLKLSTQEIKDKTKIVRSIIRTFDEEKKDNKLNEYKQKNAIELRDLFNKEIGIYE